MLSRLRLPRRQASVEAFASEPQGLDAFTSEDVPTAPSTTEGRPPRNLQLVVGFLILLVALQAYPSALWLRSGWRRGAEPAAPSPGTEAPASAAAAAAPVEVPAGTTGCEPAPMGPTAAVPSSTPGSPAAARLAPPAAAPIRVASPQALAGMLSVNAPVPLRVYEKGKLVGTTAFLALAQSAN